MWKSGDKFYLLHDYFQASMKLSKEQVVSLSSAEMVNNFLVSQKQRITDSVKQTLAVAEIYKLENLKVWALPSLNGILIWFGEDQGQMILIPTVWM